MDIEKLQRANDIQSQLRELEVLQRDIEQFESGNGAFRFIISAIDLELLNPHELAAKISTTLQSKLEVLKLEFESL